MGRYISRECMDLSEIVYDAGNLQRVNFYSTLEEDDEFDGVLLVFEATSCFIRAINESDEVELLGEIPENYFPVAGIDAFKQCVGYPLQWAWFLINQQGYQDGIKLEFTNGVILELVVVASYFQAFVVIEI
jgi:hypothetical protein